MKLIVVQVRVRVKCIVDSYPDLISTTFAIVPADLHELLSTAKNLPEMSIKIYLIRLLPIFKYAIVPADLRSAGIEYKDLLIRLKYRCITKVNNEKFNAMFALKI